MSDTPTHTGVRAVFLSYAREDAEVARRIAEALRGFGIEVWSDIHELQAGDAWDSKICDQVKSCALFMPLVSQRTAESAAGTFRREWNLAVERTHEMTGGRTFILPVVIDGTAQAEAAVPEEFRRYPWTRLPAGELTPEFVTRVKRHLEVPKKPVLKVEHPKPPTLPPHLRDAARIQAEEEAAAQAGKRSGIPKWTWAALVAVIIGVAVALGLFRKSPPPAPVEPKPATSAAPVEKPADKSIAVIAFTNMSEEKARAFCGPAERPQEQPPAVLST